MPRAVVLLHCLPDAGSHFDWMIEQPDTDEDRRLMTWRCVSSPAEPDWDGSCELINMHRSLYLAYEGPISGGRGEVQRVAQGEVLQQRLEVDQIELSIRWGNRVVRYSGCSMNQTNRWVFRLC